MNLITVATKVISDAEALKGKGKAAANEANTKALLIEPVLGALGWSMADIAHVSREYKVFDGTFLDYALLVDGEPRLFVEAKAVGESLDTPQFIAQTINYANNEGVIWCVLTNGLTYRVYKTNEPVPMAEKLLFEVSLDEIKDGDSSAVAAALKRLSPAAVQSNELDSWGEQIFADKRVRAVLAQLAAKPPSSLLEMVERKLGKPKLGDSLLKASLQRALGASKADIEGLDGQPPTKPSAPKQGTPSQKPTYTLEHHTAGKPASIVDLFEQVDAFAIDQGPDVTRRIKKRYVGYFVSGKSFFTAEFQKTRLWIYLRLDPTRPPFWIEGVMRDVRNIGHFGLGDTEFDLKTAEQLGDLKKLIQASYEANSS